MHGVHFLKSNTGRGRGPDSTLVHKSHLWTTLPKHLFEKNFSKPPLTRFWRPPPSFRNSLEYAWQSGKNVNTFSLQVMALKKKKSKAHEQHHCCVFSWNKKCKEIYVNQWLRWHSIIQAHRPSWDVYDQPYIFSPIAWSLVYKPPRVYIWHLNF